MRLYSLDDFSDAEKLCILEIATKVCVQGQDKKYNKSLINRKVCQAMDEMFHEIYVRVASEREDS